MIQKIKNYQSLLWDLAKNDFKTKYVGSALGIIWAFIQPIITILVYWLVFQYGLRIGTTGKNYPYSLWFITGIVPWFFFSDGLTNGTNCLREYNYLVKKVIFPVELLPLIKLLSSLFVHVVFIGFLTIIYAVYGRFLTIHPLRLFYYIICLTLFTAGLMYFSAAVVVFFKDWGQLITVILQIGMWGTPILWDYHDVIPSSLLWLFKLNPMFYIVEGYRDSMLENISIWSHWIQLLYTWSIILAFLICGFKLFRRLTPHFADVL